jgi:hypothetical protein
MMLLQRKLEREVQVLQAGSVHAAAHATAGHALTPGGGSSRPHVEAVAVEERSPVIFGDYLVLKDSQGGLPGFVTADAATLDCGIQNSPPDGSDSLVFDNYVFQVNSPCKAHPARSHLW